MKKIIFILILFGALIAQEAEPTAEQIADNIAVWIGKIAVLLAAVAALDPTNKIAKILGKILGVTKALGFMDKDKKK